MSEKYKGLKVKELQDVLVKKGLTQSGKKEELIERLVDFDRRKELEKMEKELELDVFEEQDSKTYPSMDLMKESVLSDDEDLLLEMEPRPKPKKRTLLPTQETNDTSPSQLPNPATPLFQFTPITFDKKEPKKLTNEEQAKLDAQRRMERMKRFGMKGNDEEMKVLRAARFGTPPEEGTPRALQPQRNPPHRRQNKPSFSLRHPPFYQRHRNIPTRQVQIHPQNARTVFVQTGNNKRFKRGKTHTNQ
ncbi:hypothetical protein BY458DRAFT_510460 [Sporodiniella umbellata]|nr:hypothetical protein BY458DRAFT_510460 [Sporodiniella umbellata]